MTLLEALREDGRRVRIKSAPPWSRLDSILEVEVQGETARFAVETRARAPYPNELDQLEETYGRAAVLGTPLLAVPFVSEGLGRALARHGWSWLDDMGNYLLVGSRFELARRVANTEPRRKRQRLLPQGSGALAIIRFLIVRGGDSPFGPTELANIAKVTQPRASQVLARLHDAGLLRRTSSDPHEPDRETLLDAFLNDYRGPGGSEVPFYTLDPPQRAAELVTRAQRPLRAISADVGPDLIAAWRAPTHLIVYVDRPIDPKPYGFTQASDRSDANVLVRVPEDSSVFARWHPIEAELAGRTIKLVDPTQMMWDLHNLGGDDRAEAAGQLKTWILRSR